MKSEMNNSSCSTKSKGSIRNSTVDSTRNQGDLREIRNQGDMRDVTDGSGNKDRINMINSNY